MGMKSSKSRLQAALQFASLSGPAAPPSPGSLLEMQTLGSQIFLKQNLLFNKIPKWIVYLLKYTQLRTITLQDKTLNNVNK